MIRDHASIDELLAVRALGGLDAEDASLLDRELAAHGECEECRRLEAEHLEVAGLLAYALDPRPVPGGMVDGILGERRRDGAPGPGPTAAPPDELARRRDARLGRWQAAFGVAAGVALLLAVALVTGSGPGVVPGQRFVRFQGAEGDLAMAYTPGSRGVVVWGTGLPEPGRGRIYEVWLIEDDTPVRGACLTPRDGSLAAYLDADIGTTELMAVTIESPSCPDAPTTAPVYTAELA